MSVVRRRMTLRRRKIARMADHEIFEREFAIESLKSDRLRVTILIGAIVSLGLILFLLAMVFFREFEITFHGNFGRFLVAVVVVFGANLCYLLAERIVIDGLIK